ncbi:MAG TPA: porin [Steroidobacteraceae bacterium]|nr:porin [Steroidobacteraceae bacterium]
MARSQRVVAVGAGAGNGAGLSASRLAGIVLLLAACAPAAHADDGDPQRFSLSGFGTLGAVHSSEHQADFTGLIAQPNGAGASHDWDWAPDSKLGLQLDMRLGERVSAVVQLVAQHQSDNDYAPRLEWANLRFQLTNDLSARIGRIALPLFMVSESRLVGYANTWLRPPLEVYNTGPITSNDGVDVSWRGDCRGFAATVQALAGHIRQQFPGGIAVDGRRILGVNATVEHEHTTLHLAYTSADFSADSAALDQLFDGYLQIGEALSAVPALAPAGAATLAFASAYRPVDKDYASVDVGFTHDPGAWFATGEWVHEHIGSSLQDSRSAYLTLGVRWRALTPYVTWAGVTDLPREHATLPPVQLPAPFGPALAALNEGIGDALAGYWGSEHSWSLGVRYDLTKSADLKLQLDHLSEGADSSGFLINAQPGYRRGGTVNVVGLAVDFVF